MHKVNDATVALRELVFEYSRRRLEYDPAPLDSPQSPEFLLAHAGQTITEEGLGGPQALKIFEDVLAPATISTDHPGYLSFIPTAPTEASKLFDLIVSASAIYGGSWLEGAGAVFAENQVLSWLAAEAGLPATSGGVFVQGGTLGNLSALVAARHRAIRERKAAGLAKPDTWKFICSAEAHSSLKAAAAVMDIEIIKAAVDENGRLQGESVQAAIDAAGDGLFALVATAGTTNFGIVDNLDSIGQVAKANNLWFHVDGAYGLAGILAPSSKPLFKGLERADSFIVDPHKWLFAPYDACALVYREPENGRLAHTQHGEYLDTLTESGDWNPSDYAYNLTRRPRGLPLWFSLATHGIAEYRQAVETNIQVAKEIAEVIRNRADLKLVREPELSVVVFTKDGWTLPDYDRWSKRLLDQGEAFVVPSSHQGKPNARFAIVNPRTTLPALVAILDSMED
jgi:glutamate/tyrosine decarboxylase-like PLP-dependent enzyme